MFITYPAIFLKENKGYSVFFPNFSGGTCGEDINGSYEMAEDFLGMKLKDLYLEGEKFPSPVDINLLNIKNYARDELEIELDKKQEKESFKTLIGIDIIRYIKETENKTVRKSVTIPSWLNVAGERMNLNFSKLLKEAVMKELEIDIELDKS